MSLPVTIEGQKYFVSWPSISDFRSFKQFLAREKRRARADMLPANLPDDELKRRMAVVDDECDAINPLASMGQLTDTPDGAALLFFGWLHLESPQVTLDWASAFVTRCDEQKKSALEGLREVKEAMVSLIEAKKNEMAGLIRPPVPAGAEQPSTSTASTSG